MPKPAPTSVPYGYSQQQSRPVPFVAPQPPPVQPKPSGKRSSILKKMTLAKEFRLMTLFFSCW